ncbi:MAG: PD-(D/E)XK nuclease family protein [Deltaproteobacteria bacterium]|nr:PD-(D/E)XK nuclease family protein [Deltaproteobacteria bacterium]
MTPFVLIPWQNAFLEGLKQRILEECLGDPGQAVVIFPHNRPRRYLAELFKTDADLPRPLLLPRLLTIRELFMLCRARLPLPLAHRPGLPDAVALLHRCVRDLASHNPLHARLGELELADFFPWGVRLFGLLEECLGQNVLPRDIAHAEAEVSPLAAALLSMLGAIHGRFMDALRERHASTQGLDAFTVANNLASLPPLFPDRRVFLAGFVALTGTEDALLGHLWGGGARVCLHSDPALASPDAGSKAHWSCEEHARWLRRWNAGIELHAQPDGRKASLHFLAGHDLHSQLHELGRILQEDGDDPPSTAVLLTDPSLLMPVLHHLPRKDVNVSLGYPLERSPLWRLLEILFRIREGRREDGRYYWRSVLEYLRHPYLRALTAGEGGVREHLGSMEDRLLAGGRFVDLHELLGHLHPDDAATALCGSLVRYGPDALAAARSPRELALALERFCRLLLEQGESFWRDYPIDAECLFRLMERVLPALCDNELADSVFPPDFLHALARECVRAERAPFEADPLMGVQVLGMLETRLLHFARIFVLDATDDRLPGASGQDPLLPDALRAALDLPHTGKRDQVMGHTLFRLLAGAESAYFFWQEGVQRSALFEGKKQRSRFVEELLWQREQAEGRLFGAGQPPLGLAECSFEPPRRERRGVERSPELDAALRGILAAPLSASGLNSYVRCPLRFLWERPCRIAPVREINEGDDPAAVGELIHSALHALFRPWLGGTVHRGDIGARRARECFEDLLRQSSLHELLPPDSYYMLELAGPERLRRFLESQPDAACIVALEKTCRREMTHPWGGHMLTGTVDRVDIRTDGALILEYKTGSLPRLDPDVWEDAPFWQRLENWDGGPDGDPLPEIFERLPDVQLPCYLHLCGQDDLVPPDAGYNAAWVALREDGAERPLFRESLRGEARARLMREQLPLLFGSIVRHMECSPIFQPREGGHCAWCPYGNLCLR